MITGVAVSHVVGRVSLMDGWLPLALQAVTAAVLSVAAVWCLPQHRRARWTPPLLVVSVVTSVAAHRRFPPVVGVRAWSALRPH